MSGLSTVVLGGGRSSEHEVSLASAASVAAGLRAAGHHVREITIARDGAWPEGIALVPGAGLDGADVVFPALHGPYGEDGIIQGLLECLAVPYVGSGVAASALCLDKVLFKDVMAAAGVPQVAYRAVDAAAFAADPAGAVDSLAPLGLPVFVKPVRMGSSVGIARVNRPDGLADALTAAFTYDDRAIVEAAAPGLEVECSVLGNRAGEVRASAPGEILLAAGESAWYDYAAKYTAGGMRLIVPARISPAATDRVRALAVEAFIRAGCDGLARADFFVAGEDVLLNELNTMPGFTQTSVYGALWAAEALAYPDLLDRLVHLALERHRPSSPPLQE
ncbi:D-alanine--D-alanine ligase family protein [Conexibacter sp. DBS9H8]|uniref:D-alanine--D-alanine ligase family protein n=1 Tax=Conexibacter sp. DBS9H8 TaxID=2937801 RepID=UPI00200F38D4|nr:D-alanine--D-alanine ligase family protein [Conexibacter sp. DBS9H8]